MKIGVQFRLNIVILAVTMFAMACSSPAGGGGGDGGSGGGVPTVINIAAITISIIPPAKGESPSIIANNSGEDKKFTGTVTWSPEDNPFLGSKVYTASVTLTANSGYTFPDGLDSAKINGQDVQISDNTGSAVTLSHTFPATNDKIVTDIAIKTQPTKLTYKQNDKLDLTGLVVTLTHDDKTTEDVTAANFADKNITTDPSVGSNLVYPTNNGQLVKIIYGSITKNTNSLTVAPPVNAVQPVISAQPQDGAFFKTGTLSVTASVTDGGNLSYQWYRNTANNTTNGTAISGATGSSYALSDMGTYYCYVIVTNTITNNGDGGTKTARTTSNVVAVTFELAQALWARSVNATVNERSSFNATAVDSSGNVYAAGYQRGNGIFTYGEGKTAQGTSDNTNVVLVKYASNGVAQWAKTVSSEKNAGSCFTAVAVDKNGYVYAAGYQNGSGTFTYSTGVFAQGNSSGEGVVLVKYDSNGTALWAKTISAGNDNSHFNAVAVDSSGNVYAAGYQYGSGTYTYSTGVSAQAQGDVSIRNNVVLVKYDSNGMAQWAKTVSAGSDNSLFNAVAVDSLGNVYAAGYQYGSGTFTYSTGVSAQGAVSNKNVVLVKYDSSGMAQWAKTVNAVEASSSLNESQFNAVAVDSSGNVYAAGYQYYGSGTYTYSTGVSAQGAVSNNNNVVLVKYNSSGTAQWAKTVSAFSVGSGGSGFNAVAVDSSGNVYAAGYQNGRGFTYSTGVSAQGSISSINNVVLVKYDSSGMAQWAKVNAGNASSSLNYSMFNAVTVDSSSNVYAAGYQHGSGTFTYSTGVSAQGSSSTYDNVVLVKYEQ